MGSEFRYAKGLYGNALRFQVLKSTPILIDPSSHAGMRLGWLQKCR